MSRHISSVSLPALVEVLPEILKKKAATRQLRHQMEMWNRLLESAQGPNADPRSVEAAKYPPMVQVAHGYDHLKFYFLDLMPDCEIGIFYGYPYGLSREVSKEEYIQALDKLGLYNAKTAVMLDIDY